jgi:hypothetical protein
MRLEEKMTVGDKGGNWIRTRKHVKDLVQCFNEMEEN